MATQKLDDIFTKLRITKEDYARSIDWFKSRIKELNRSSYQEKKLLQSSSRMTIAPVPGRCYMYSYDAVHKDTLPYWDSFPCGFYLGPHPDPKYRKTHFYSINLHYLNPDMRLALLKKLTTITNNPRMDATTRIKTSWELLSALSKSNNLGIQNCIKMYRKDAMLSRFLEISSSNWFLVSLLPVQNFHKASSSKVWYDSKMNR
jgi:hypothetical protein